MIGEASICSCGINKQIVKLYTPDHIYKESVWDCLNDECLNSIMFNANKAMPYDDDDDDIDPLDEVDWNNYEGDYLEFDD